MLRNFVKTGFIVGNLVLGLTVCNVTPIQAAEFTFKFDDEYYDMGYGSLSFKESPLTGVDGETITLSALYDYCNNYSCQELPQFDYQYLYPLPFGMGDQVLEFGSSSDVTFEFDSGYLTGIFLSEKQDFSEFNGRSYAESDGFVELSLNGDTYNLFGFAITKFYELDYEPVYDEDGNYIGYEEVLTLIETSEVNFADGSGAIEFTTIEPVPEPFTILGAMTALGFGGIFKRKLFNIK